MRKLATLIGLTGLLAFALGSAARAIPPEHFPVVHVDETDTIPAAPQGPCAFPIEVHIVGDARHTHFFDKRGNVIRELTVFSRFRVTFSANGKSITTVSVASEHVKVNPDGSATVALTGLQGRLIVRGGRPLAADVGRVVFFFSGPEDEDPDLVFQAGQFNMGRSHNCATCWLKPRKTWFSEVTFLASDSSSFGRLRGRAFGKSPPDLPSNSRRATV